MQRVHLAATAALLVSTTFVVAQPEQSGLRAIQTSCMNHMGAWQDPKTHRLHMNGYNDMQQKVDAVYDCVKQKTGRPADPFITQSHKWY